MSAAAPLVAQDVSKSFGKLHAVKHVSLQVDDGEVVGFLGPNGAGKTTFLRVVAGLIGLDNGSVHVGGYKPGTSAAARVLGYMPQQLALYPELSARENVAYFAALYGILPTDARERGEELLQRLEIREQADALVRHLSGGTQRRVMLATVLVHRPRLLILDEPTAGVDPSLRLRFWRWLRELCDEGMGIVVTTHHISEAAHADRVVFVRHGEVLDADTPDDILAKYRADNLEEAFVRATEGEGS